MEKTLKKLNNCLLSFNSKASSALCYERDNASNIKWLEIFLDRIWWKISDWLMISDIRPAFIPLFGCVDLMESDLYVSDPSADGDRAEL